MNMEQLKQILRKHPEKVAAGAIGLLIIFYLLIVGFSGEVTRRVEKSKELLQALENRIADEKQDWLPPEQSPEYSTEGKRMLIYTPEASPGAEWFAYKRPFVPLEWRKQLPKEAKFERPTLTLTLEGLKASLKWQDSPENDHVAVTGYVLYRKVDGGDWEKLKEFGAGDTPSYEDDDLNPLTKYTYRVDSSARPHKGFNLRDPKTGALTNGEITLSSAEQSGETQFPWRIKVHWTLPDGRLLLDVINHFDESLHRKKEYFKKGEEAVVDRWENGKKIGQVKTGMRIIDVNDATKTAVVEDITTKKRFKLWYDSKEKDYKWEPVK